MSRELRKDVFGYFDGPEQRVPAHDPGIETGICALCGKPLDRPVRTFNILPLGTSRSYFYRVHKLCDEKATEADRDEIDSMLVDAHHAQPPPGRTDHSSLISGH